MPTPKLLSGLLYSGGKLVRVDGRAATALRPVEITPHFISSAEGSALIRLGETRVICTASVEDGVPPFLKGTERGWITSEYGMIPRATETRTAREAISPCMVSCDRRVACTPALSRHDRSRRPPR